GGDDHLAPVHAERAEHDLERAGAALHGDREPGADDAGEGGLEGLTVAAERQGAGAEGLVDARQNLAPVLCRNNDPGSRNRIHWSLLVFRCQAAPGRGANGRTSSVLRPYRTRTVDCRATGAAQLSERAELGRVAGRVTLRATERSLPEGSRRRRRGVVSARWRDASYRSNRSPT